MVCTVFSPCSIQGRVFTLQASEAALLNILIIASIGPRTEVLFHDHPGLQFQNPIAATREPDTMSYENRRQPVLPVDLIK
jgi:hypothetical protein